MLNNLFTGSEKRAITFQKLFEIGKDVPSGTRAGVMINEENSLKIGPVYAAIRLISDSISTLPMDTFFRQDGERLPFRPRPMWVDNPELMIAKGKPSTMTEEQYETMRKKQIDEETAGEDNW